MHYFGIHQVRSLVFDNYRRCPCLNCEKIVFVLCYFPVQGAKINAVGKDGFTPLLLACWKGHADVVRELVAQKADITIKDHQLKTCLHWCVEMGHCELVDIIIESETGSELMEHQDKLDHSPMHYSAEIGNKQVTRTIHSFIHSFIYSFIYWSHWFKT